MIPLCEETTAVRINRRTRRRTKEKGREEGEKRKRDDDLV